MWTLAVGRNKCMTCGKWRDCFWTALAWRVCADCLPGEELRDAE